MIKQVKTSEGNKSFIYESILEGNVYFTTIKDSISKNETEFSLSLDFSDSTLRFSKRDCNVIISVKPTKNMNMQFLIDENSEYKDIENSDLKEWLVEAFELLKVVTIRDLLKEYRNQ